MQEYHQNSFAMSEEEFLKSGNELRDEIDTILNRAYSSVGLISAFWNVSEAFILRRGPGNDQRWLPFRQLLSKNWGVLKIEN